jgi:hypothetical protein
MGGIGLSVGHHIPVQKRRDGVAIAEQKAADRRMAKRCCFSNGNGPGSALFLKRKDDAVRLTSAR